MAQFGIYRNNNPASQEYMPYLLDVQSDLLDVLNTRVIVPLERCSGFKPADRLSPVFVIEEISVAMSTPELAGIHERNMGEVVTSVADERDTVIAALDMLFTGY